MPNQKGYRRAAIIFIVLWLACISVPLITMVVWAFNDSWPWPQLAPTAFSLRGMTSASHIAGNFGQVIILSIGIALSVSLLCVIVASLTARALVHHNFPGKHLWKFGVILPFIIPSSAFAMGVQSLFTRLGLSGTVIGVVLAVSIVVMPYAIAIMIDVTEAAGKKLEEQASVLGANKWRTLRHAILPSLLPGILSAASLSYILAFMQYFLVYLVGTGFVKTIAVVMFPFLAGADRTVGTAYATVFVAISLAVFFLFNFIMKRCGVKEQVEFYH